MVAFKEEKVSEKLSHKIKQLRMDAMPNIVRSTHAFAKLAWSCLLFVSLALCTWLIVGSIHDFLKYEVSTSTRMRQEAANRAVFPTLTICQINPLTTDYSVTQTLRATPHPIDNAAGSILAMEEYAFNTTGELMTDEQKRALSSLEQMLVSCRIGNALCNASDFSWMWHPVLGGCYRFNADRENLIYAVDTPEFAFSVELYAGLPNYWSDAIGYGAQRGFYLYIQNATEYPLNFLPSPIMITTLFSADITVRRSFYSQFNKWPFAYSECRVDERGELMGGLELDDDDYLFEQVKATNFTYSRSTCISFCAQLEIVRECGCNYHRLPMRVENYNVCFSVNDRTCSYDFFKHNFIAEAQSSFVNDYCDRKCPFECLTSTLAPSLAFVQYPTTADVYRVTSDPRMKRLVGNQTDFSTLSYLAINLVKISVHYDTLGYRVTEEKEAMSVDALVGTLGGHLHLFLGMSLVSFLEVFELAMTMSKAMSRNNKTTRRRYKLLIKN